MHETILKVHSINKNYGNIKALENISFELKRGDIFGLLGRNGGGKTTLIKILTSMIMDYSGQVELFDYSLRDKSKLIFFKQNIAYLPDKDFLYPSMNPVECAKFFASFFSDFSSQKAFEIFAKLDILPTQKIGTMSKGQAEKVGIALTLARNTSLYLFDEPLAGADVISRDEIFRIIQNYCSDGATLIATHLISSVEPILNCALFLNKKCMAFGSKEQLLHGFANLEDSFRYYAADSHIKPLLEKNEDNVEKEENQESQNSKENEEGKSNVESKDNEENVDSQNSNHDNTESLSIQSPKNNSLPQMQQQTNEQNLDSSQTETLSHNKD